MGSPQEFGTGKESIIIREANSSRGHEKGTRFILLF
jgi:hypothetical protein